MKKTQSNESLNKHLCIFCGLNRGETLSIIVNKELNNIQDKFSVKKSEQRIKNNYYTKIQGSICKPCLSDRKLIYLKKSLKFFAIFLLIFPLFVAGYFLLGINSNTFWLNENTALINSIILFLIIIFGSLSCFGTLLFGRLKYNLFSSEAMYIGTGKKWDALMDRKYAKITMHDFYSDSFDNIQNLKFVDVPTD